MLFSVNPDFIKALYKTSRSLLNALRYFEKDNAKIANLMPIMSDLVIEAFENGSSTNTGYLKAELGNTVLLYMFGRYQFEGTTRYLKSSIPDAALALYYLNFAYSNMSFWQIRQSALSCESLNPEEKLKITTCIDKNSR